MSEMDNKKIMISVAPVSAAERVIDPAAIAEDVYECYKRGASMVHLHARDKNGALTSDLTVLDETVRMIREKCDIVIEISTGGVSDLTIEERCQPCYPDYVEANSLNVGSVNLGKAVYQNPIEDVKYCVRKIMENDKRPEVEVFELGMIHTMKELDEEFHFIRPILFTMVCGHGGEMPSTPSALRHMVEFLEECFPNREDVIWGYTQAHRKDFAMMGTALSMGAKTLRIGFEDSDYLKPEKRAKKNFELVETLEKVLRETGREPMTPAEVREMLKIQ